MKERTAKEGMWLTQATLEDESTRLFVKKVCGFGDLDSLYMEWTEAQKQEWEAEHPVEEPEELTLNND